MCNQYQPIHTESRKGYTINIHFDTDAGNPRQEYDNLGCLWLFNQSDRFINLSDGDEHVDPDWLDWLPAGALAKAEARIERAVQYGYYEQRHVWLAAMASEIGRSLLVFPVRHYWPSDHHRFVLDDLESRPAAVTQWIDPADPELPGRDGPDGVYIMSRAAILDEYGWKLINADRAAKLRQYVTSGLDDFAGWLNGECYYFEIEVPEGRDEIEEIGHSTYYGDSGYDYCIADARRQVDAEYEHYLANLDAYYESFDICQAYAVLEPAYNKGGWLQDRPSNRRRREACSTQLARLKFRPGAAFDYRYEDLTENGRAILHLAISRMNLPDWFTAAMEPAPEDV